MSETEKSVFYVFLSIFEDFLKVFFVFFSDFLKFFCALYVGVF